MYKISQFNSDFNPFIYNIINNYNNNVEFFSEWKYSVNRVKYLNKCHLTKLEKADI